MLLAEEGTPPQAVAVPSPVYVLGSIAAWWSVPSAILVSLLG